MANLNFDFEGFAHLDEALEAAALEILESEKAEIIHISDAELDLMAEEILVKEEKRSFYSKVAAGAIAFIPAAILSFTIGAGIMSVFSTNSNNLSACTSSPEDVCEVVQTLPSLDKDGNVREGW